MPAAPAWLPDWRDAHAYPSASAGPARMAWQFLRRNPNYQADWARWAAFLEAAAARPELAPAAVWALGRGAADADPAALARSAALLCEAEMREGLQLGVLPGSVRVPLGVRLAQRWGLSDRLQNPAADRAPTWAPPAASVLTAGPGLPALREGMEATGVAVLCFDLAYPLPPQLGSARRWLTEAAKDWRARHPERDRSGVRAVRSDGGELVEMLRVLDAASAGVDPTRPGDARAIAAALWPKVENTRARGYEGSARARRRWRSGVEYRDGKYLALTFMATYRPQ